MATSEERWKDSDEKLKRLEREVSALRAIPEYGRGAQEFLAVIASTVKTAVSDMSGDAIRETVSVEINGQFEKLAARVAHLEGDHRGFSEWQRKVHVTLFGDKASEDGGLRAEHVEIREFMRAQKRIAWMVVSAFVGVVVVAISALMRAP